LQTNQAALKTYAIAFALSYLTAGIGGGLTELGPWYFALKHPDWKPPDPYFGVIWSVIFTLCAISGAMAWQTATTPAQQKRVLGLFAVNAFLNILWSAIYFKFHRPDLAVFEVVFLWLSILLLVMGLWNLSKKAALLLVPYWVWVTIATVLNVETVKLNGPF
jgi:tryptophan-rich sensory protein